MGPGSEETVGSAGTSEAAASTGGETPVTDTRADSPEGGPSAEEMCRAYCDHDVEMCALWDDDFDDLGHCYQDCGAWFADVEAACDQAASGLFACLLLLTCEELEDFWGEVGDYPCKAEDDVGRAACSDG